MIGVCGAWGIRSLYNDTPLRASPTFPRTITFSIPEVGGNIFYFKSFSILFTFMAARNGIIYWTWAFT